MKTVPQNRQTPSAAVHPGMLAMLFFASGALALVYEVVWQRQFALVLGSAAPATVAVLAAYFAGLGLGSVVLGRFASRWRRPLRVYAVLEAAIGAGALAVSPLIEILESMYLSFVHAGTPAEMNSGSLLAVRLGVAFAAIFLPTFCMGGTLPVLATWVDRGRHNLGVTAGWLYVANTVGAAAGALLVPFCFLPAFGLGGTVMLGAALNGVLALGAGWLDRRSGEIEATPGGEERRGERGGLRGLGWVAGVSGAVTFALQVGWNRAFAQVHENSMHSFAVVVAMVILALAVGAQIARVRLRRGTEPRKLLGVAWGIAGIAVMAGPWLFHGWTNGLAYLSSGDSWGGQLARLGWIGAGICFVPTMLLGVGLPALMEEAGRCCTGSVAAALGRLLAMNIGGSVAGALFAGFVLPGWLGLWNGLVWAGALVIGVAGAWGGKGMWRWLAVPSVVVAAGLGRMEPPRVKLSVDRDERLVSIAEGAHGIVAVVEREGSRRLKLNNHYALGGTAATGDERMQAHLPLLLHAAPESVAFLGLGTGVTAGGALFHPIETVVAVELVPEVIAAARAHFRDANAGVLEDARVRVIADDARHFLRGTDARFDVIVGDLVVPWRAGEGALFTREQFVAAREALAPGGVFCQWLPLFQLSEIETEILLRTFLSVFPRAELWRGDFSPTEPALALVGRREDAIVDAASVRMRIEAMQDDPANPHLRAPGALWMHFVGIVTSDEVRAGETRVNTENRPWVELLGPKLHGGRSEAVFAGRELETWLARIRVRTRERGLALGELEMRAMDAGAALAEMILAMKERDRDAVEKAREEIARLLPEETLRALLGAE
jgi:Spermidine synthase